ncbi:MAG: hypothetical protein ABIP63_08270 [Thermoanaerobaculia bacterium]
MKIRLVQMVAGSCPHDRIRSPLYRIANLAAVQRMGLFADLPVGLGRLPRQSDQLLSGDGVPVMERALHFLRRWIGFSAAVLFGLFGLLSLPSPASAQTRPGRMVVATAEAGPIWASQATFDRSEERIVIADPGSGRVYVYASNGRILRRIASPGRGVLEFEKPNLPFLVGERFLIAASPYRWVWFSASLEPLSGWSLEWEERENGRDAALAPYEVAVSETALYAIGAVQSQKGDWSDWGVFEVPLNGHALRQLSTIDKDAEERSFYQTPPSNLAACGANVFLLTMGERVSIEQVAPASHTLRSVPAEFRNRPSMPALTRESLPLRKAAQRNVAAAEGLFCRGNNQLLLLTHRPRKTEGVQWLVYPIDASKDVLGAAVELPTFAAEIIFVPGVKKWAILEKGEMKRVGIQPLTRIITFPAPATRPSTASPLRSR